MSLHFYTFPVHFSRPPFFGLIQWFRAKTTWKAHPIGFLSSKRGILAFPKIFSRKSWFFSAKTKKKILLILFVPECPETRFRHNLQLFLLYKSIKTGKRGQFWHFLRFLAIFGDFHFWQNLGGIARPNGHFQPWIWKFNVWSTPGCARLIPDSA